MRRSTFCLLSLLAPVLATPAWAHTINADGDPDDWNPAGWEMDGPGSDNLGLLARDAAARGQYVWRDRGGDERRDANGNAADPRVDITELRVTSDATHLFLLVRMTDINAVADAGAPQIQVAIDRVPGQGQTWLGSLSDTQVSASAAWEYLFITHFGSNTPPVLLDTAFAAIPGGADPPVAAISDPNDTVEIRIPWALLGGVPTAPLRFTVASLRSQANDDAVEIGDGNLSDVLDAVTNYGDPGASPNTWDEVSDGRIDYYFELWFHLDPDTEPAAPLRISEIMANPGAGGAEWIEIHNVTAEQRALDDYRIGDEETVGGGEGMKTLPAGATLAAGGAYVVASSAVNYSSLQRCLPDAEWTATDPAVPDTSNYGTWANGSLDLSNTGDEVLLLDPRDTVIDAVAYGTGSYPGTVARSTVAQDHSLERVSSAQDTNDATVDFLDHDPESPRVVWGGAAHVNTAPTLTAAADLVLAEGEALVDEPLVAIADPDLDELHFPGGGLGTAVEWSAGSGFSSADLTVTEPRCGADGELAGSFTYLDDGAFTITARVCDESACATAQLGVTVTNVAPQDLTAADRTLDEGTVWNEFALATFTDPGTADLHDPAADGTAVDWGDGAGFVTDGLSVEEPVGANPGRLLVSRTWAQQAVVNATVRICDEADCATTPVTLTVSNVAPAVTPLANQSLLEGASWQNVTIATFTDPGTADLHTLDAAAGTAVNWGDGAGYVTAGLVLSEPAGGNPGSLSASRTWASEGTFNVSVRVCDDLECSTVGFVVQVDNAAPVVVANGDQLIEEGSELNGGVGVDLELAAFADPGVGDLHPLGLAGTAVDWGDGAGFTTAGLTVTEPVGNVDGNVSGRHIYAQDGTYPVTVRVCDEAECASDTFDVLVLNVAPLLVIGDDISADEGSPVADALLGLFGDPGSLDDHLPGGGLGTAVDWGEGAGFSAQALAVTEPLGNADGEVYGTHTFADNDAFVVTLRLCDDDECVTDALLANISNVAPTLTPVANQSIGDGTTWTDFTVATFTDPGSADTFPVAVDRCAIDFGDGNGFVVAGVSVQAGALRLSRTWNVEGVFDLTLRVCDDDGGCASGPLQVTVNNQAPVVTAAADQTLGEGAHWADFALATFTDSSPTDEHFPGGAAGTAVDWADGNGFVTAGLALTEPAGGNPGTLAATHDFPSEGVYAVTVRICDEAACGTDTLSITVQNVAPTVDAGANRSINEGQSLVLAPATFTDPGAGDLHPTGAAAGTAVDWGAGGGFEVASLVVTEPAGGDPGQVAGNRLYVDNGDYTVIVRVCDEADCGQDSLTLTVNNVAPTVTSSGNRSIDEGQSVSGELATFTDPGTADAHTATINWGDGTSGAGVVAAGAVSGTHTYANDGNYTATVEVCDDDGGCGQANVTVAVANVAPTVAAGADQNAVEGATVQLAPATFTDPGGETDHTASINWGDGSTTAGVVDGLAKTVAGSHVYADNGLYTVTVTVDDGDGGSASDTLAVTVTNAAPVVNAGADQASAEGSVVSLAPASFTDAGSGDTHTASINWGDGTVVDGDVNAGARTVSGSHTFTNQGSYTVTVTVTDDDGGSHQDSLVVTVSNVAPLVDAGADQASNEGASVSLPPATFTDPGAENAHTASIDWGDGTVVAGVVDQAANTVAGSHVYADQGSFTVTVSVDDGDGGVGSDTFTVTVSNVAPTLAVLVADPTSIDEAGIVADDLVSFTDPGAENAHTASIDWGDGTVEAGDVDPATRRVSGIHQYVQDGDYTVRVTVSDGDGGQTSAEFVVQVSNVAPVVVVAEDQLSEESSELSDLTLALFDDVGVDDLHWNVGATSTAVNWGEVGGDFETANLSLTEPVGGQGGSLVGSHTYAQDGDYTVTVRICDEHACTSDSFLVVVVNAAPTVAASDPVDTFEGQLLQDIELAIFDDPGTEDLHWGAGIAAPGTMVDWGEGAGFSAANLSVVEPQGGNPGQVLGSHTYAQDGEYLVEVRVCDDDECASDVFLVAVANVAPVVNAGADQNAQEGTTTVSLPPATFVDPGAENAHTATIDWGDGTAVAAGVVDQGANTVSGSHVYANQGTFTVTVTVDDGDGGVGSDTFLVTVANVAPVVDAGANQNAQEGTTTVSLPPATFVDPGAENAHTATINWGDGTAVVAGVVDQNANTVSGSHVYANNGTFTVTVTVSDGDGGTGSDTFTVTVANVAPVVDAGANQNALEGTTTVSLPPATFVDPGGENDHTATINWGDGSAVANGVMNQNANTVSGSHVYANQGSYTVTVTVNDGDGGVGSDTFVVTVANVAPTVDAGPDQTVDEGRDTVSLAPATFTDPGSENAHTATIDWGDGTVEAGSVAQATNRVSGSHVYQNDGSYTVTVTVDDGDGGVGSDTLTVTVRNVAPAVVQSANQTVDEFHLFNNFLLATYTDPGPLDVHWPGAAPGTAVDWGEGAGFETQQITLSEPPPRGAGELRGTHRYLQDGVFTVQTRICDDDTCVTQSFTVTVRNVAPVLIVSDDRVGHREAEIVVEPGGNHLLLATFTDLGTLDMHEADVDWGDPNDAVPGFEQAQVLEPEPGNPPDPANPQARGEIRGSHTYCADGTYTVRVRLWDEHQEQRVEDTFVIRVDNVPPVLDAMRMRLGGQLTQRIDEGSTVQFELDAHDQGCDDQGHLTYRWEFADGTADSATEDPQHLFDDNCLANVHQAQCTYRVHLTVIDTDNATDEDDLDILVDNVAPSVAAPVRLAGTVEGAPISFRSSATDPSQRDMREAVFCWDLDTLVDDDGQGGTDDDCQRRTSGAQIVGGSVTSQISFTYPDDHHGRHKDLLQGDDRYNVRVWVVDGDGGQDVDQSLRIDIANVAPLAEAGGHNGITAWRAADRSDPDDPNLPTIAADGSQTVREGYILGDRCIQTTVDLLAGAQDQGPDDQDFGFYYRWDFEDGDTAPILGEDEAFCFAADRWYPAGDALCADQDLYYFTATADGEIPDGGWVVRRQSHVYLDDLAEDPEGNLLTQGNGSPQVFSPYVVVFESRDKDGGATQDTIAVTVQNVAPLTIPGMRILGQGPLARGRYALRDQPQVECQPGQVNCLLTFTVPLSTDVEFSAEASCDPGFVDNRHLRYEWYFGDIQQDRVDPLWLRRFETQGVKFGRLQVSDPQGALSPVDFQVEVTHQCDMQVAIVVPQQALDEGSAVDLQAQASHAGENRNITFFWLLGDGSEQRCGCDTAAIGDGDFGCSCAIQRTYADSGTYELQLSARDDQGCSVLVPVTQPLVIANLPPVLGPGEPRVLTNPVVEAQAFDLSVAFTDPGADGHTVSWDCDNDGFFERNGAAGRCTLYTDAAPHQVNVRVRDDDGGVTDGSVQVIVTNGAPTAFTAALVDNAQEGVPIQLFGSASDAGRDPGDSQFVYRWTWETPGIAAAEGASPSYVFPNEGDYVGSLVVTDNAGLGLSSVPAPVRVQVANLPPSTTLCHERAEDPILDPANADPALPPAQCLQGEASGPELTDISFVALASDPGPADRGQLRFGWNFGDGVTLPMGAPGANQRVAHRYQRQGRYSVQVMVQDPAGASVSASMWVTVAAQAPVCDRVLVAPASPEECGTTTATTTAHVDGGAVLTYRYDWGDGSQPSRGPGLTAAEHVYRQDGDYNLLVRVTDPDGVGIDCATVVVRVNNTLPRVSLEQGLSVDEGLPLRVLATVADCSQDVGLGLLYTWDFGDGSEPVSDLGLEEGSHTYAEPGQYTVTLLVEDDHPLAAGQQPDPAASNVAQTVVEVGNQAPRFAEMAPRVGNEGADIAFVACARDPGGLPAGGLHFVWNWSDGTESTEQAGVEGDARCADGSLAETVHAFPDNQATPYQVQVIARDPQGGQAAGVVTATISNVAPRIVAPPDGLWTPANPALATQGQVFVYQFEADDPGAREGLRWELLTAPQGMTIDEFSGQVSWLPDANLEEGQFQVAVRVRDKDGDDGSFFGLVQLQVGDTEGDGLPTWYEEQFACLDPEVDDALDDPDGDGLTSIEEYQRDSDGLNSLPCESNAPLAPAVVRPGEGEEVRVASPELTAEPAVDPDAAVDYVSHRDLPALHYLFVLGKHLDDRAHPEFQVIGSTAPLRDGQPMDPFRVDGRTDCGELPAQGANPLVSWRVPAATLAPFENDQDLQWMVRACDGWAFGPWSEPTTFFFNAVAEAPATPTPLRPADGAEDLSIETTFEVQPAAEEDPDHDAVCYRFVIWRFADGPEQPYVSPPPEVCVRNEGGTVTYELPRRLQLADDTRYCWSSEAVDDEGQTSEPSAPWCFLINEENRPPSSPELKRPRMPGAAPVGPDRVPGENVREVAQTEGVDLVFGPATDPDGNFLVYRVHWAAQHDLDAEGPDFSAAEVSEPLTLTEAEGTHTVGGLEDNTFYYWKVVAHEAQNTDSQTQQPEVALFFVNTGNDLPGAPTPLEVANPTVRPNLQAQCALDPDFDRLSHKCELRLDSAAGEQVAESGALLGDARGAACEIRWSVPDGVLLNNQDYCFRCRACDQPEACQEDQWGPWSECRIFRPAGNICPSIPSGLVAPAERSHHAHDALPTLEVDNVVDADVNNEHLYVFELYDTNELEQVEAPVVAIEVAEGSDGKTRLDLNGQDLGTLVPRAGDSSSVYWRVRVRDTREDREGKCDTLSRLGLFFIDGPPAPPDGGDDGCCSHQASSEPPRAAGTAALAALVLLGLAALGRRRRTGERD